jgi:acyl-CoA thioesterase FadM
MFDECYLLSGAAVLVFLTVDVIYFFRCILMLLSTLVLKSPPASSIFVLYSICWFTDIDPFMHMNNGKYLREMDYARYDLFVRSNLYARYKNTVVGAIVIRYRRAISVLTPLKIESKIVWYDDKSFYVQQRIISLLDGFVRSDALLKMTSGSGKTGIIQTMKDEFKFERPDKCPDFVKSFIASDEQGSKSIKEELGCKKTC